MVEKGPFETMGEAAGENAKFGWKGPAECKIGSSLMLKASKLTGM
jgi:hypothetical protein